MQPLKTLTHMKIQQGLQKGLQSATKILDEKPANKKPSTHQELYNYILSDLKDMHNTVIYDEKLYNVQGNQSIPALTILNTKQRKDGGIIKLNPYYRTSDQLEALYHEYAHIKDYSLPVYTTDLDEFNLKAIYDKSYLELIEYYANMIAYTLMMPPELLKKNIENNSYNIDKVLEIYGDYEKSSVLQWIIINDTFPCHFAWIMLQKNTSQIQRPLLHDNCYYDHQLNPKPFIEDAMNTDDSAVSIAIRERNNLTDGKINKVSVISGISYHCYAYFEGYLSKELLKEGHPFSIDYDRVLVIGWTESIYNSAEKLGTRVINT